MKTSDPVRTAKVLAGSAILAVLLVASCSPKSDSKLLAETPAPVAETAAAPAPAAAPATPAPSIEGIPAGEYTLDPEHSTFFFRVNHLSFSNFTLWYDKFEAKMTIDPTNPSAAAMEAKVDPASLTVHAPAKGFLESIKGKEYLDAAGFPAITFKSTAIKLTGPNTADVTGDLTLHGVTKPLTLAMTYNGGYAGHIYEPRARIGFSAKGNFKRSDFGIANGLPKEGSTMGVFDNVEVIIESEWLGPPWKDAPPGPPPAPH
ncbi:MAG TPA: YceI family protein [Hyphomonadaceae bacterium]|nr:YceI family protein [Hyphomonadaceae bacterium]